MDTHVHVHSGTFQCKTTLIIFSTLSSLVTDWGCGLGTAVTLTREKRMCLGRWMACLRRSTASLKPHSQRGSSAGQGEEKGGVEGGCGQGLHSIP